MAEDDVDSQGIGGPIKKTKRRMFEESADSDSKDCS